jgi:putative membrane protein
VQVLGAVLRFVVAAVVLMLIGYVVPGFSHLTFGQALLAAIVIAAISWLIDLVAGRNATTYGRGIVGFLVSAAVIWVAQFVVPGMHVNVFGALMAALVIGLVDLFIPTAVR